VPASGLRDRLQTRLRFAMKDRDTVAVTALRGALAAIDAAGSSGVPAGALEQRPAPVAGSRAGLGAAEAPRRDLTEADVVQLVRNEVTERETAAIAYARAGQGTRADSLRAEASLLRALLDTD
jgi:uncharacterized protein YqeY